MAEMKVTCFTDIKDYTGLTQKLGQGLMQVLLDEYLDVGKMLVEQYRGKYIKNVGDAHLATFDDLESPLQFVTVFQQYYEDKPCLRREPLRVRMTLYLGTVDLTKRDAFGLGVIKACREASFTEPTCVTVNRALRDGIEEQWGPSAATKYFESIGLHELKGVRDREEFFKFKWKLYADDNPQRALPHKVFSCLDSAGIVLTNLRVEDFTPPGLIIWPVVPRTLATAIHRGQIEIMRLLAFMDWRIHMLAADCGAFINADGDAVQSFIEAILDQTSFRGMKDIQTSLLSQYYKAEYEAQQSVLDWFRRITTDMSVEDLLNINQKEYTNEVKVTIRSNPALDFLRPILTCAAVLHLAEVSQDNDSNRKVIVVAGFDENLQWRHVLEKISSPQLGVVYNPLFKLSESAGTEYTARQRDDWPIWHDYKALEDDMQKTNAGKWLFQHFAQLPRFPAESVDLRAISTDPGAEPQTLGVAGWPDEFQIPAQIDRTKLIKAVWPIIDPSRRG